MVMVTHELIHRFTKIETFVVPSPANGTFNIKSPENGTNATFDFRHLPGRAHSTFVLDKPKSTEEDQQRAINNASIMTEDNSHIKESPETQEKPPPKAKKSAVAKKPQPAAKGSRSKTSSSRSSLRSKRIEAFEKAVVGSSFRTNKNTTPSQQARFPSSKTSTTPLASQRYPSSAKASTTQTTPTAQNGFSLSKGISSSTSKLAHLQKKPTLASANLPKSQSLPGAQCRTAGVNPLGCIAASSSSSLALDEKNQKREEKQRLAPRIANQ